MSARLESTMSWWWAVVLSLSLVTGFSAQAGNFALLVGVTNYPNLDSAWALRGGVNDVARLAKTLERFGFGAQDITLLSSDRPNALPTRQRILDEFQRLAARAGPGDQVVIHFSGHGSQQPAKPGSDEPDGLREIFLPCDVRRWNGEKGAVENAIVDDEIGQALDAIRSRGAFVWLLADYCHAGTLIRAGSENGEVTRRVPPEALVPREALDQARRSADQRGAPAVGASPSRGARARLSATSHGGLVAFFACQPDETTPEKSLPLPGDDCHGLFTFTLVEALERARSPLTYRELAEQVYIAYRAEGRRGPTPMVEGVDMDRQVLGQSRWPERPRLLLRQQRTGALPEVNAGRSFGLGANSVLKVFPPAGAPDGEKLLGYVRVVAAGLFVSTVEPISHSGVAALSRANLIEGSRCEVAFVAGGDVRLRFALQTQGKMSTNTMIPQAGNGPAFLESALAWVLHEAVASNLWQRVNDPAQVDWFLLWREGSDEVLLEPASGWALSEAGAGEAAQVPRPFRVPCEAGAFRETLVSSLIRIARATTLARLAQLGGAASADSLADIRCEMRRHRDAADLSGEVVSYGPNGRRLRAGQLVSFLVHNQGRTDLDITLLNIDGALGIEALNEGLANNRVKAGQRLTTRKFTVTADHPGPEQIVVIALLANPNAPVDFSYLAQSPLSRDRRGPARAEALTPLGRFLNAMTGEGPWRGPSTEPAPEHYTIRTLPWITEP